MEIDETEEMQTVPVPEQDVAALPPEEVWARIAQKVRADSKEREKLTPVASLAALLPELDAETIQAHLPGLLEADGYGDVKGIATASGAAFLYSETGMTGKYAEVLARIEQNDPCATIAETVRNDSRLYPRPTNVSLFRQPPFYMAAAELEAHVARTLETYDDIKRIDAPTGAVYLYSDRFMKAELARSHVRWIEVEQDKNP